MSRERTPSSAATTCSMTRSAFGELPVKRCSHLLVNNLAKIAVPQAFQRTRPRSCALSRPLEALKNSDEEKKVISSVFAIHERCSWLSDVLIKSYINSTKGAESILLWASYYTAARQRRCVMTRESHWIFLCA